LCEIDLPLGCTRTMNKQDITMHSDSELSLVVMNDESLYRTFKRLHSRAAVESAASELFTYTEDQFEELITDMVDDDCFSLEADD